MAKLLEVLEKLLLVLIAIATLFAVGIEIKHMIVNLNVALSDLLLLFIYAEVIGMLAAYYTSRRIPVTLPIIIAMTALARLIILQNKDIDQVVILYQSGGILLLSIAALVMSVKDRYSIGKVRFDVNKGRTEKSD